MSIRARLLLLILFATLVPALAGVLHFVENRDAEVADAGRRLATEAGRVAGELQDIINGTAQLLTDCRGPVIWMRRSATPVRVFSAMC